MIIRDDLLGQTFKPGSFISEEAMKSAQETVLETARRPEVIRKTLETLGPERKGLLGFVGGGNGNWPSDQVVEDFRGSVSFESANGGEFGKSEVIVLAAKGSSPKRSVEFLTILTDEIDKKLSEIQGDRFQSMESELRATRDSTMLSRKALEADLIEMESGFEGTEIHLYRSLNERGGGSPSAFENKLNEIATQRRDAVRKSAELKSIRQMLLKASKNSVIELPTSAELLASQPALSEMVTGLTKAKQDLAQIASSRQPSHPQVKAARDKVASIKSQIQTSIGTVVRGLDSQIEVQNELVSSYDQLRDKHTRRLTSVSRKRVPYATLSRQVEKLNEAYSEANARLTLMQSRKMASDSINLLTRIGEPWVGTRADGMGNRTLSLIGGIAGLFIGLGMVMIVAPPFVEPNRSATNEATATVVAQEDAVMQELGRIIPTRREEEVAVETAEIPKPVSEFQESELIVEREVVPQPQVQSHVELPPLVYPEPGTPLESVDPTPVPSPDMMPASVAQTATVVNSLVDANPQANDQPAEPAVELQIPVQESLPPQAPPIVIPNADTDLQRPATIKPQHPEVQKSPQLVDSEAAGVKEVPPKRPGAKTIAAIFANMPQPKTDLVDPSMGEPVAASSSTVPASETPSEIADRIRELANESNAAQKPTEREETQTIQLDVNLATTALPLQRRSSARPVDLAKTDDGDLGQQSIDQVFSQLTPPKQFPQEQADTDVNNQR